MIIAQPGALVAEIASLIESARPTERDLLNVRQQVLSRQARLRLTEVPGPECVAESLLRCQLVDHLQHSYGIDLEALPDCVNSSHTMARGVCGVPACHSHQRIADADWANAWRRLQREHPEVNVLVPGRRAARRADLYVVTHQGVVSVEFKYVGPSGLGGIDGCAGQMRRYIEKHAATLLAIYDGGRSRTLLAQVERLRDMLSSAIPIVIVSGPAIQKP